MHDAPTQARQQPQNGSIIRAAVAQFHVGSDLDANLAACLRALDRAGKQRAQIVALPEFCNHMSWYEDATHCRAVSIDLGSTFLAAIAQKAREIMAYVAINVTLNRDSGQDGGIITGSSLLYGPDGRLLGQSDKQVLIGHENDFLTKARQASPVLATDFARVGLYACMDGVIPETPRALALGGAQILLNSLNSFAQDEACLHVPVRASENKVFVMGANKIGPLVPPHLIDTIAQATSIPSHFLHGAGESQIVGPDGEILAKAPQDEEALIVAEFDPQMADQKCRPDGTNIFAARRPELYAPLITNPSTQSMPMFKGGAHVAAALVHGKDKAQTHELITMAFQSGARIVAVAPTQGLSPADIVPLIAEGGYVGMRHCDGTALLIGRSGIVLAQAPIHTTVRFGPSRSHGFDTLPTPYGRIGLVGGDDGIFPEAMRLMALTGAEIVIAPVSPLEDWELRTGLIERAAENRLNLLAPASGAQMGLGAALQKDFTLMTPWATRPFDGYLSHPIVTRAIGPLTRLTLYPASAANKLVSRNTDLLKSRPWHLASALTDAF